MPLYKNSGTAATTTFDDTTFNAISSGAITGDDVQEILDNQLTYLAGVFTALFTALGALEAVNIIFDNSGNGFAATDVQNAIEEAATSGANAWGDITGTLSAQTDLQSALDAKLATTAQKMRLIGTYSFSSDTINFYGGASGVDIDTYTAVSGDMLRVRTPGNKDFGAGTIYGEENDMLYYDNTIWKLIKNFTTTVGTLDGDSLLATGTALANQIRTLSTATYPSLTEVSYVKGVTSAIQTQLNTKPTISSGTSAPATTPGKVGDIFVDTSALKLYFSAGTSSSADWIIAN